MSKRNKFPGAFALPGLADMRHNSDARLSDSRTDAERNSVEIATQKTWKTSTEANHEESSSLLDESGELLPQQPGVNTLKHLTKSRPRSSARRPGNQTKRERSRSPDSRDVFEYYAGLKHDTESTNSEDKQNLGTERTSRSRKSKNTSKSDSQYQDESQQRVVWDSNVAVINNNHYPTDVSKLNHSSNVLDANLDLDMSQHDSNSDEDLGEMLIGDYIDSDDSNTDDKPPLPSSPPPDLEVKASTIDTSTRTTRTYNPTQSHEISASSKLFPSLRNTSEDNNDTTITKNTTKLFPSISNSGDDKHHSTDIRDNTTSVNLPEKRTLTTLPGNRHSTSNLIGSSGLSNQSSARRRRFKPVSIDSVEPTVESDKLFQSDSIKSDSPMNRTFPGSSFDSSDGTSKNRKEVDWGLRTSTLNSSFSESTLKSGTIFDKFLKGNTNNSEATLNSEANQDEKVNVHNTIETHRKSENVGSRRSNNYNDHYRQEQLDESKTEVMTETAHNRTKTIPDIKVHPAKDTDNKEKKSLSNFFSHDFENDDYEDDEIIENGSQYSDDDNDDDRTINHNGYDVYHGGDDDDRTTDHSEYDGYHGYDDDYGRTTNHNEYDVYHDGDDEDDDDEPSGYSPSFISDHTDVGKLEITRNALTVDDNEDITHITDMDEDSIVSSDEENMIFNESLGSVIDTHDNTMYSPGEIPGRHIGQYNLDSREELFSPPEWEMSDDGGDESHDEDDNIKHAENGVGELKYHQAQYQVNEHESEDDQLNNEELFPEDDVIQPPELFDKEGLFEPPAMFASDEEEEEEDDFVDVPPPLLLSPVQNKTVMPFHKIPLGDWTEEDTLEWLHYVGLGHFKQQFKAHQVNGRTLKNIDFQLLEEIGISAPDERELILAEIYELDNPSEEEHLEAEIQDALETASEQDKEKILAVLTALRSPTMNNSMEFPAVQGSELDSDQGYPLSSDTGSVTSSVAASDDHSHRESTGVTPSQSDHSDLHLHEGTSYEQTHGAAVNENSKKLSKEKDKKKSKDKSKKKNKGSKKEKKSFSKFWESLSISHTSSKLTKLFGSKKFNPAMQYLLQAGPQGILRVWPTSLSGQTKYCSFMVSMTTTSAQVVHMVLEKYDAVVADPLRYYLCEVGLGKGAVTQTLGDNDCPLTWQCRWHDPEKFRFEIRCRDEGSVRMLFEMEGYDGDLDYRSIAVSSKTPCKDVLPLIVKKYDLPGKVDDYQLMEVSEDNEDDRRVVRDHVCPLQLQKAWNEPDHVFRLVRKHVPPPIPIVQPQRVQELSKETPELIDDLPRTQSDVSSLPDGYETDSTDHPDNTSEEADLPPINKELEDVVMEVQDSLASQQAPQVSVTRNTEHSEAMGNHLEELRKKDDELQVKDREIEELKRERDELLEKENELLVWRMRNDELVQREEELEQSQNSLLDKDNELPQKDKEIEDLKRERDELLEKESELLVWRMRNDELVQREEELEQSQNSLLEKDNELPQKDKEIENLKRERDGLLEKESELLVWRMRNDELVQREEELEQSQNSLFGKDNELPQKNKEIEELKRERDVLLEKESELLVWRMRNDELVEREDEIEKLQNSLLEKANLEKVQKEKELEELRIRCFELSEKNNEAKVLGKKRAKILVDLETSLKSKDEELIQRDREIERLYQRNTELISKEKEVQELRDQLEEFEELESELERIKTESAEANNSRLEELETSVQTLQFENESLQSQLREANNTKPQTLNLNGEEYEKMKLKLELVENENRQLVRKSDDLQRRNNLLEKSAKLLDSMRQENQILLAKTKETDEMKRNIIKLTSQLREAGNLRLNQGELEDLKLRLSISEAEKQHVQSRLDEAERHKIALREDVAENDRLKKENRLLQGNVGELDRVHRQLESMRSELKETETLRQKNMKAKEIEMLLTKELNSKESVLKQKDGKIEEMDKKIKAMTDAMKKMEAKFKDQNEQRENLSRLLTVIKDKDPALLRTLHKSIVTSNETEEENEEEEWC